VEQPIRQIQKTRLAKKYTDFCCDHRGCSLLAAVRHLFHRESSIISVKGTNYRFDLNKVIAKTMLFTVMVAMLITVKMKSGYCTDGEIGSNKKIVSYGDSHAAQWFPTRRGVSA